jgi:hypothetical protein
MAQLLFPKPRGCPVDLGLAEECETEPRALLDAALRMTARGEISPLEGLDVARLVEKRARVARVDAPVSGLYPEEMSAKARQQALQETSTAASAAPSPRVGEPKPPAAATPPLCKPPVSAGAAGPPRRRELLASASPAALAA